MNRLDAELVNRGLSPTRSQAVQLIERDRVRVDGKVAKKPSQKVSEDSVVHVVPGEDYVSRAGHKLAHALRAFDIDVSSKYCFDVGASTGGFTDCLLQNGASAVLAIDVGHGQFNPELLANPKVKSLEGINIREATAESLGLTSETKIDLVVMDLSFISATMAIPSVSAIAPAADVIVLIKPQFEAGKTSLNASGLVTAWKDRAQAISSVIEASRELGYRVSGLELSPITGTHGNQEYLLWITKNGDKDTTQWSERIIQLVRERG